MKRKNYQHVMLEVRYAEQMSRNKLKEINSLTNPVDIAETLYAALAYRTEALNTLTSWLTEEQKHVRLLLLCKEYEDDNAIFPELETIATADMETLEKLAEEKLQNVTELILHINGSLPALIAVINTCFHHGIKVMFC